MPPDPPRGELAKLIPSPSPVTLHYSPTITFLNENPGKVQMWGVFALKEQKQGLCVS